MERPSPAAARFRLALLRARVAALELGLDLMAVERDTGEWLVPSVSRRLLHVVTRQPDGTLTCTCEACRHGRVACVHRAAVSCLVERRQARTLAQAAAVTAPAAVRQGVRRVDLL